MQSEPRWISLDEIIWINEQQVAETGEPHRVRDEAMLESAAARPKHHCIYGEKDLARLATALLYGVLKNHPFEQGNKRTGVIAALMFLEVNGYRWTLEDDGELAEWVLALVTDELAEEGFAEQIRPYLVDKGN